MWDDLLRVDWGRLTHAYGWSHGVPKILLDMVSPDEPTRTAGWSEFWGAVNHQGDYYDSTVAAIPFLVEAVSQPEVPDRAVILNYFRDRWLDAPVYGGDPVVDEPPGGTDEPTPMLTDAEFAAVAREPVEKRSVPVDEEFDTSTYRSMDLCAWQTGRAIQAGRRTFEGLLDDPDRAVAAAVAGLLLLWPETRGAGKQTLIRAIEEEPDPVEQARRILEFGVYAATSDVTTLERWVAPAQPIERRAAAALAWAWLIDPGPLPSPAVRALDDAADHDSDGFARLPWEGIWHRGPWILPANIAGLILRLAGHRNDDLRWRAVQGLAICRDTAKHLPDARVVPVLIKCLCDPSHRVRSAAALALSQRGESVLAIDPAVVPVLIHALDDTEPSACGHAARLLAMMSHQLTRSQRVQALAGVDRAVRRFAGQQDSAVYFDSMATFVSPFLKKQRGPLGQPTEWAARELLVEFAFPDKQDARLSPAECDRKLADAYAGAPERTIAAAMEAARDPNDRTAALGAANWLMTLGPAAESALPALDAMAEGTLDRYARDQARTASAFIRGSLLIDPDPAGDITSSSGEHSARVRIARLARAVEEHRSPAREFAAIVPELIDGLAHPDPYVRARSAELLGRLSPDAPHASEAIPWLVELLSDDAIAAIGLTGRFEFEGRLYHWHQDRRSPRVAAIRALFQIGRRPEGDRMLRAMIATSLHVAMICGRRAVPHRFPMAQWRSAAEGGGGLGVAERAIRAARQHGHRRGRSIEHPNNAADVCTAELTEIIRQLSGRLV